MDRFGVDVFGQPPTKKQFECVCPNCQRNMAASRFAPHLEKCMGMGRNSSRIASRRQAAQIARETNDRYSTLNLSLIENYIIKNKATLKIETDINTRTCCDTSDNVCQDLQN